MVFKLFCGRSNVPLAEAIGRAFEPKSDLAPVAVPCIGRAFNDGEPNVQITNNVRGEDVFLVQSTHQPGDHLVELLAMANAAELGSAASITAVLPYFGYARQDRKVKPRTPITAQAVCRALEAVGIQRLLTTDLHAGQIQGFFRGPFDNLEALPVLLRQVRRDLGVDFREVAFVSPDDNGVERCRETGKLVDCGRITFYMKGRNQEGELLKGGVIRDPDVVRDRACFLIDDIVDTGGSLVQAALALAEAGASHIYAVCVHPVLSTDQKSGNPARNRITASPIERLYVTDTIPLSAANSADVPFRDRLRVVSVAPLFAGAIQEIQRHGSVSAIFRRTCAEIMQD